MDSTTASVKRKLRDAVTSAEGEISSNAGTQAERKKLPCKHRDFGCSALSPSHKEQFTEPERTEREIDQETGEGFYSRTFDDLLLQTKTMLRVAPIETWMTVVGR